MQKWIQPPACSVYGLHICKPQSYSYLIKYHASRNLFCFFLLVDLFGLADFVVFQAFQIHWTSSIHVRITNAALQTGLGRPQELLYLDLDFGLLASSRDPNFTGRHLFRLDLRVVGILHTFFSRAVIQWLIGVSPAFMEYGLAKKSASWAHANRDPNKQEDWIQFCMKRLRAMKSFKIFNSEIKKL